MSDLHGLQVAFTPELIEAMERLIDERVQVALETHTMNAKRWLTPREAGELLACSERAVYERVRKGRIPAEAVKHSGRRIYIDRKVLDRAVERSH